MQFETIEFESIDEIVELIKIRFENAHIEFNDDTRDSIICDFSQFDELIFNVDAFNELIECNVRVNIAHDFVMQFMQNENEFEHIVMTTYDAITFELIDAHTMNVVRKFIVNNSLQIQFVE